MPAATTPIPVAQRSGNSSKVRDLAFQASVVSPGNNFPNTGRTMLAVRNTTVGALDIILEGHLGGVERTLMQESVPGSGTDNGIRIFGPFETDRFNNHNGVDIDRAYVRQATGSNGDLTFAPFEI
jgi:hypothetical protein